jgi:hypothetical protein
MPKPEGGEFGYVYDVISWLESAGCKLPHDLTERGTRGVTVDQMHRWGAQLAFCSESFWEALPSNIITVGGNGPLVLVKSEVLRTLQRFMRPYRHLL